MKDARIYLNIESDKKRDFVALAKTLKTTPTKILTNAIDTVLHKAIDPYQKAIEEEKRSQEYQKYNCV